jgi:hypothetical protein
VRWKRAENLAWQTVDSQTIVVDLERGRSLGLNETGGLVWQLLADMDEEAIAAEMGHRYGVEEERAARDVRAILAALRDRGLIEGA